MKITASNTQQAVQNLAKNTNQTFQENVKISDNPSFQDRLGAVSYTHLRAHET